REHGAIADLAPTTIPADFPSAQLVTPQQVTFRSTDGLLLHGQLFLPSDARDAIAAAHYLRARREVDPARIGVWGGSYGGYMTALSLARDPADYKVGV